MTLDPAHVAHARKVADAVLYEGYLLYPYRHSAQKNRVRFQFGVLMPLAYHAVDDSEPSASQTECLLECTPGARVWVLTRFLHLLRRSVQGVAPGGGEPDGFGLHGVHSHNAGSHGTGIHGTGVRAADAISVNETALVSWDEAVEREHQATVAVSDLLASDRVLTFRFDGGQASEDLTGASGRSVGQVTRRWAAIDGAVEMHAERTAEPYGAVRLRLRLANWTRPRIPPLSRDAAVAHALVAAHMLIGVSGGTFLSMTDGPEWASEAIAGCKNVGTWPVLAGPAECRNLMLSSPVILYDHPEIAPESAGDLFDSTEIDEILTLRTLALTDAEKQEARATDKRAAELLDRLDGLPSDVLDRMHGAIRYLTGAPARGPASAPGGPWTGAAGRPAGKPMRDAQTGEPGNGVSGKHAVPWWDPGSDMTVSPETDHVVVDGVEVSRGSRVRMRPGTRRADAQDLFLMGREALVEAVLHDVDGQVHVAVTRADDPLAELQRDQGRFLYFAPDELEPAEEVRRSNWERPGSRASREPGEKEKRT